MLSVRSALDVEVGCGTRDFAIFISTVVNLTITIGVADGWFVGIDKIPSTSTELTAFVFAGRLSADNAEGVLADGDGYRCCSESG